MTATATTPTPATPAAPAPAAAEVVEKDTRVISVFTEDAEELNDLAKKLSEPRSFVLSAAVAAFAALPADEQVELAFKARKARVSTK